MTRHHRAFTTLLGGVAAVLLVALPALGARTYTVSRGDSAWKIAKRLGVSTQALLSANHLTEHSVLHPGQRLVAPERGVGRGYHAPPNRGAGSQPATKEPSISNSNLSTPDPNPIPGVDGPPSISARPSYRPPPMSTSFAPNPG